MAVAKPWKNAEVTAHLHASPIQSENKIAAAWEAGCRNFDVALGGFGGCPMAEDKLVGNLSTEAMLAWAEKNGISSSIRMDELSKAQSMLSQIFT
jgi:hydroxymethylglutaryl-CoA lyase